MRNPDRPRCVFCDLPFRNQNDLICHERDCSEVVVTEIRPPIGTTRFDWSATLDGYDGAPDAGWQPVGYGPTKDDAIADLKNEIEEHRP